MFGNVASICSFGQSIKHGKERKITFLLNIFSDFGQSLSFGSYALIRGIFLSSFAFCHLYRNPIFFISTNATNEPH